MSLSIPFSQKPEKLKAEKLFLKYFKFPVAPQVKEVNFKTLNGRNPSAEFLKC